MTERPERGYRVWCQGGPADDWIYETLIEPDDEITLIPNPHRADEFIRFLKLLPGDEPWPGAVTYRRVRDVEQVDGECIYYPAEVDPPCKVCGGSGFTTFNYGHTINPDGSLGGRGMRSIPSTYRALRLASHAPQRYGPQRNRSGHGSRMPVGSPMSHRP